MRLDPEGLALVSIPRPDATERSAVRRTVSDVAGTLRLEHLIKGADDEAREAVMQVFSESAYRPQPFGLNWGQSLGLVSDRVAMALALQDACAEAILADALPDDVRSELREGFDTVEVMVHRGVSTTLGDLETRPLWVRGVLLGMALLLGVVVAVNVFVGAGALAVTAAAGLPVILLVALVGAWRRRGASDGARNGPGADAPGPSSLRRTDPR